MLLVRFVHPRTGQVAVGVSRGDAVTVLAGVRVGDLLAAGAEAFAAALAGADGETLPAADLGYLPPIDGRTEVWAAGVTYQRSQQARTAESGRASIYQLVYTADRPELFFKAPAWRAVGPEAPLRLRTDSGNDVPEPELGLVTDPDGVIVGYLVGNDLTSRAIEGQNPLYLPQAKIWRGSCALGPGIRPVAEVTDPTNLDIRLRIVRDGAEAFAGSASTGQLHRELPELVGWLHRELDFPAGAVLLTGTCIVPDLSFTLRTGDTIEIDIDGVGTLRNPIG